MLSNTRALTLRKIGAAAILCVMATGTPAQNAVTYQMNPAHTGVTTLTTPLQFPMSPAWTRTFGGSVSYPLIANGMVYVVYGNASSAGYGSNLIALNASTGATVWGPVSIAGTYYESFPAYDNGVIYVVNFDGLLRTYNATTGVAGWTFQLPSEYFFTAPPTATGGLVFLSGTGTSTLYAVSEAGHVISWSKPVNNGDASSPAVSGGDVYVGYVCQYVYSFFASNGFPLWHTSGSCSGGGGDTTVVANGKVYARDWSSTPTGHVLNAANGTAAGSFDARTIPAIDAQTGYFLQTGSTLSALSLANLATVNWSFAGDGHLTTPPIVVDNQVFIGSSQGAFYALDKASGAVVWQIQLHAMDFPSDSNMWPAPAAAGGTLVVPAQNVLYGFNADHLFANGFEVLP